MLLKLDFVLRRVACAALVLTGANLAVACASVLGIDDGKPMDGGGADSADVTTGLDAVAEVGLLDRTSDISSGAGDGAARDAADSSPREGGGPCVPDANWCKSHCGSGPDNCGLERGCADNCAGGRLCDTSTNLCTCRSDPTWCSGRCGVVTDNCGTLVDCGDCQGGLACAGNTCGCIPNGDPCGSRQCGQTLDSCNHPVACGVNGICAGGGVCDARAGMCCKPAADPCAGRCGVSVDDGCGQMIACPGTCAGAGVCDPQGRCCSPKSCGNSCGVVDDLCGQPLSCSCGKGDVCYQGACCTPGIAACSPTCTDSCGQPAPCCSPSDGGPDGAGCGALGASCQSSHGCCSGYCNAGASCASFCSGTNGACSKPTDCCSGLTCFTGPAPDGGFGLEGGAGMPQPIGAGLCQ